MSQIITYRDLDTWQKAITKAYANHVGIALGSHGELETCIEIGLRLKFLSPVEAHGLVNTAATVGRLLNGLYSSLERKLASDQAPSP